MGKKAWLARLGGEWAWLTKWPSDHPRTDWLVNLETLEFISGMSHWHCLILFTGKWRKRSSAVLTTVESRDSIYPKYVRCRLKSNTQRNQGRGILIIIGIYIIYFMKFWFPIHIHLHLPILQQERLRSSILFLIIPPTKDANIKRRHGNTNKTRDRERTPVCKVNTTP